MCKYRRKWDKSPQGRAYKAQKRKRWRVAHKDQDNFYTRQRRYRKKHARGSHTLAQWKALVKFVGQKCVRCGCRSLELTEDHILPLSVGGTNYIWNIQPLCGRCNSLKHTRCESYIGLIVKITINGKQMNPDETPVQVPETQPETPAEPTADTAAEQSAEQTQE